MLLLLLGCFYRLLLTRASERRVTCVVRFVAYAAKVRAVAGVKLFGVICKPTRPLRKRYRFAVGK